MLIISCQLCAVFIDMCRTGSYDYEMTSKLMKLAKALDLNYAVDIYPFYQSDVTAALHAGHDIRSPIYCILAFGLLLAIVLA